MADEDRSAAAAEQRRRQRQMNERQEDKNPFLDYIGKSVEVAIAVKSGKMLMRRTGLASVAERGLNFSATFARRMATSSSFSKAVEDWTIDDIRNVRKMAGVAFKEAREVSTGKIRLNPEESRSLFSHLRQLRTMRNTEGISDADNAWTQRLINHATENLEIGVKAARMDANEAQRYRSFISNVASGVHKENIVNEQIKRAGFTGAQRDFAQKLVDDMKAYSKKHRTPFMLDWRKRNKAIMKEMASLDEMEEAYGTLSKKKGAFGKLVDAIQGENEVTVRDLLKNKDKIEVSTYQTGGKKGIGKKFDPIQDMEDMRKFYARIDAKQGTNFEERFLNITADVDGLGKDARGNIYSKEGSRKFVDSLISGLADSLPGKILKARDFEYARFAPKFSLEFKGSYDPVLAALTNNKENHGSSQLDSTIFHTGTRYFRVTGDRLEEIEDLRGVRTHMASGKYGARKNILKQMTGDVRYKQSDNKILRFFDIGQDRDEFSGMNAPLERIKAMANKYDSEDYFGNIIDSYTDATNEELNKLHDTINNFAGSYQRETAEQKELRLGELLKVKSIRDFMHDNTYGVSRDSAGKLAEAAENKDAKRIFQTLESANHEELIDFVKNADFDYISDTELKDVSNRLQTNPRSVFEIVKQKESRSNTRVGSSINDILGTDTGKETETVDEFLRTILTREAFAKESASRVPDTDLPNFQQALDLIKKADLNGKEEIIARRSAMTSYFDDMVNLGRDIGEDNGSGSIGEGWQAIERAHDIFIGDDELTSTLRNGLRKMRKEKSHFTDTVYENPDEIGNPIGYNSWVTMRDAMGPLDMLNDLNSWTKTKANVKQFFKQFYAGRDSMESVSEYTQVPYFMLSRLSDEMNKVGLGFSKDNMGSTVDLASAIMLKRVIPIGVAATYYEWADDTSQEVTGMSITGAAAQGVANVDIASRKLMDTFGITDWMKGEKSINPIMQYWGDHDEFQSADERRKWYESGYTPVRKGAWWTFGGVNEARGGAIQYFEPTFVRRIQSDYEDKSLYDGYFDKWSHSLLPTPTNPFSPILGILDPYWLEEKHKDDRPYELTGHMFADGTPWGAILNPTIGELIKPQKSLHTIPFTDIDYRNVNGIDPLSLLHGINEYTKQKARDLAGENYIQIGGSNFDPINFVPYDHPTDDTNVLSVQFKNGQLLGTRYGNGGPNIGATGAPNGEGGFGLGSGSGAGGTIGGISLTGGKSAADALETVNQNNHIGWKEAIDYAVFGGPVPNQQNYVVQKADGKDSYVANKDGQPVNKNARHLYDADRLEINRLTKGDTLGIKEDLENILRDHNPANWLRQMNEATKAKAGKNVRTMSQNEIDAEEGMAQGLKLKNYRPVDAMNLLNDPDTVTDLINQGKGSSFVQNAAVSWRLIAGIYGYGVGEATGFGVDNKKRIATGQDITSFSRTFWDENLGGLGGPAAEIMRRFIPDYRRNARINPLMNEMPDWLPDRFRYGDAMTAVPKGEMRLPGKGYESLNQLHPDQFGGKYGAFDRMKILADIAPFSPEYKMWRDIAKKTVTDPELIDEMSEIRQRVNQQGKQHDFYDYKVVGHGLQYKNVVVSEVLGYGKFRSGNSIFKIAGASVRGNPNESMKDVLGRYIHVGQTVTVAVDEDSDNQTNNDSIGSINAAVYIDGQNVGKQMISAGDAAIRKSDNSTPAVLGDMGVVQKGVAYASEFIAHLDLPWISDQFLRVRSPLESYEAEQVYGTPYQTWSHPIETFLRPALERSFHDRSAFTGLIGGAYRISEEIEGLSPGMRHGIGAAYLLSDRGAFIGAALSQLLYFGNSRKAMEWARHGSMISTLGHVLTGGNSYTDETLSAANVGQEVARFFEKSRGKGALIGAAVGALYRTATNPNGEWIPQRTKKKWEMQDYYDRLTYLKFMGLYKKAAKKAKDEEDVDIEDVIERREEATKQNRLAIKHFQSLKKDLVRSAPESEERDRLTSMLTSRINDLEGEKMVIPGGKWTRTALLYKQAAENTMYGLKEDATWSQIITALPQTDREYFMEFVKERNKNRREEILNKVSPFLNRALKMAWGMKEDKQVDNETYFKKHALPQENWAGWAPQFDLKNSEIQSVVNSDLQLGDFGFYESELDKPQVAGAPRIQDIHKQDHNSTTVKNRIEKILKGQGLKDVDISVEAGPSGGATSIKAAIKTMLGMRDLQDRVNESLQMQAN